MVIFVGDERFSGRVDRWLHAGTRKKVEAFELTLSGYERVHFPGWTHVEAFEFDGQPKLGPARVYERPLPLATPAEAAAYLAGNRHGDVRGVDASALPTGVDRVGIDDLRDRDLDDDELAFAWSEARDRTWERAMLSGLTWYIVRSVSRLGNEYREVLTMVASHGRELDDAVAEAVATAAWDCAERGEELVAAEVYWPRLLRPLPSMPMFLVHRYLDLTEGEYRHRFHLG